jgi:hypothetical protein
LITVGSEHPTRSAISLPFRPCAAHNTIRARSIIRASDFPARTIRSNSACSPRANSIRLIARIADLHPR